MDPDDPTSIIFRKIKTLEPVNATIIIGHFLSQKMEQVDLIRIAYGPYALVQTLCRKALSDLGLSSNSFSGNTIGNIHHHQPLPQPSPRNGFLELPRNPNPLSPSLTSGTLRTNPNFDSGPFCDGSSGYFVDEQQLSNQFSFLNDENPHANLPKRSFSANDPCLGSEKPGFGGLVGYQIPQSGLVDDFGSSGGFRSASERGNVCLQREEMMRSFSANDPCLGGLAGYQIPQSGLVNDFGSSGGFRSASESERQREEMMRMNLAQKQRLAANDEYLNFLCEKQFGKRQGSGGQCGEDGGYYSSQSRHERDDSVLRHIYLTFPSDSTFTDGDVFSYFSDFGTVDEVRIPRQDKRVFGFVCFANAETARTILAQGNPHIIGGSVVLVKPYKDNNKRQQQQLIERGPMMMRRQADSEVQVQRRSLQLAERENESIDHPQPSLSLDSLADFPPLQLQPEGNTEKITEGDSDISESHLQLVANRNDGRSYSNDFNNR